MRIRTLATVTALAVAQFCATANVLAARRGDLPGTILAGRCLVPVPDILHGRRNDGSGHDKHPGGAVERSPLDDRGHPGDRDGRQLPDRGVVLVGERLHGGRLHPVRAGIGLPGHDARGTVERIPPGPGSPSRTRWPRSERLPDGRGLPGGGSVRSGRFLLG